MKREKMRAMSYGLASLLLACTACAGDADVALPQREAGVWEITVTNDKAFSRRMRQVTTQQCTDDEVDARLLLSIAPGQEHCTETRVRQTATGWEVHTTCDVHGNPLDTRFILEGDFRNNYSGSFETRYGGNCPRSAHDCIEARTFSARHLGACPDNLHPGDTMLPNGIVVNSLDEHHRHDHD